MSGCFVQTSGIHQSEGAMDTERRCHAYDGYTIPTLVDDGVWWATVRTAVTAAIEATRVPAATPVH
jgi:hypothetical protein